MKNLILLSVMFLAIGTAKADMCVDTARQVHSMTISEDGYKMIKLVAGGKDIKLTGCPKVVVGTTRSQNEDLYALRDRMKNRQRDVSKFRNFHNPAAAAAK